MGAQNIVGLPQQVHVKPLVTLEALEHAKLFLSLYKRKKLNESIK